MRIESVTAHAFGPLVGQTLELAPGMTVITGPNEAAKSSWHAAIYAALCGRRRGKGRANAAEQAFIDKHKPWNHPEWAVSARLTLDDARRIEIRQDLDGKVDSRAVDVDLSRDVSHEIIHDGAPDAAGWLNLDRRSFAATACVEQAQLLSLLTEADSLQQQLQRAADTAGSDSTAAKALSTLEEFTRDNVGLDRANSTKPMRAASTAEQAAAAALATTKAAHDSYLLDVARLAELAADADVARHAMAVAEAAAARRAHDELATRLGQVRQLLSRNDLEHPTAQSQPADADLEAAVAALHAWRSRPHPQLPAGQSAAQLRSELAQLPCDPTGPQQPDPRITAAATRLRDVIADQQRHAELQPPQPQPGPPTDITELLGLAAALSARPPTGPSTAPGTNSRPADTHPARKRRLLTVAGVLAVLAALSALASPPVAAGIGLVAVLVAVLAAFTKAPPASQSPAQLTRDATATAASTDFDAATQAAQRRCRDLGISADPARLRELIAALATRDQDVARLATWQLRNDELRNAEQVATTELDTALVAAGYGGHHLLADYQTYLDDCAEAATQAQLAARRGPLQEALRTREYVERVAADASETAAAAQQGLLAAAAHLGAATSDTHLAEEHLSRWCEHARAARVAQQERRADAARIEGLLDGSTVEELELLVNEANTAATAAAAGLDTVEIANQRPVDLTVLREQARAAAMAENSASGALRERARSLGSVAEAEERHEAAKEILAAVQDLAATLDLTTTFLRQAQEAAHRTIAPKLRETLQQWLPKITGGRYVDATVNPQTLHVEVCGPDRIFRPAGRLSYGTAEQIYLLLRLCLVEQLTAGKSAPLLFDDITVQSDTERTNRILDLLHELSKRQQIVVFAQQDAVEHWAQQNLDPDTDLLLVLPAPAGL